MSSPLDNPTFDSLLARMSDGELTDAEHRDLSAYLRQSSENVSRYVEQVITANLLQWEMAQARRDIDSSAPIEPRVITTAPSRRFAWAAALLLGATAITAALLVMQPWTPAPTVAALMLSQDNATWAEGTQPIAPDETVLAGRVIALESGEVRLGLLGGGGLVLSGPCRFTLDSAASGRLEYGYVGARVPSGAESLQIVTAGIVARDIGTEFGVDVDRQQRHKVYVFEGRVHVTPSAGGPGVVLDANVAGEFDTVGAEVRRTSTSNDGFPRPPAPGRLRLVRQMAMVLGDDPLAWDNRENDPDRRGSTLQLVPEYYSLTIAESFESIEPGPVIGANVRLDRQTPATWTFDSRAAVERPATPLTAAGIGGGERALLLHGRTDNGPTNRVAIRLEDPESQPIYISFLARFEGLDEDDFYSLWLGPENRPTGSPAVNVGLKSNRLFVRHTVNSEQWIAPAEDASDVLFVVRVTPSTKRSDGRAEVWLNPTPSDDDEPTVAIDLPRGSMRSPIHWLGFRLGANTESTDRLWIDRLRVGSSFDAVLTAEPPDDYR